MKQAIKTVSYLYSSVFKTQDGSFFQKVRKTNKLVGEVAYRSYVKPKIMDFEKWLEKRDRNESK